MKRLYALIVIFLLAAASANALQVTDFYKAGDEVDFAVQQGGKVVGSQHGVCKGWQVNGVDSLQLFEMTTKTVFERGGKTFDLDVACEVGYLPSAMPKTYQYTLTLLSTKVTHSGEFGDSSYSGRTTRMGVTTPLSFRTQRHPLLFDNNFALQWEICTRGAQVNVGDSVAAEMIIPQLSQAMIFKVHGMPSEKITIDGREIMSRVLKITPANQILYFDGNGKLLKAYDPVQKITVLRLPQGAKAEIASESLMSVLWKRLPIYGLLAVFAAVWFLALAYRDFKRIDIAVMIVGGGVLFWLSLKLLEFLQTTYFGFVLDPRSTSTSFSMVLLGSALLFAVIEELTKFVCVFGRSLMSQSHKVRLGIALGAAAGAGFALMQAGHMMQFTSTGGLVATSDLVQKFFAIGLNTATGAMIGFLIASRWMWAFYLIPVGLKMLFNWLAFFVQKGTMRPASYTVLTFVLTVVLLGALFLMYRREMTERPQRRMEKSR
jgi:RsiW-degrading membrane proteinase PrsW (M82 family)